MFLEGRLRQAQQTSQLVSEGRLYYINQDAEIYDDGYVFVDLKIFAP